MVLRSMSCGVRLQSEKNMSKDFPNRSDWLARRATPAKFPGRMIHVSKLLVTVKTATGQIQTIVSPARGTTLNIGSNRRKAKRFAEKKAAKAAHRAMHGIVLPARRIDDTIDEYAA